ncbi:MAG: MmgE/PrpD family protein [Proteobacteria bacterium]|nr:MmgE/PrpD family protein [Pseudomonadota bacterium]
MTVRFMDDESAVMRAAWLGNALEMDDVHRASILHPGPVIWPTVLAGAGESMDALLDAAVRGYEATIAIGATFDAFHYARFHNTATAGVFGAAAASASLNGCDADVTVLALGLAGSVAGGLWRMRHETVDAKQWHVVHAATTGMAAARYASRGISGPWYILEGDQGFYAAMAAAAKPMTFARGWRIAEVSFKPWAACRHAHPAIDAALELKQSGSLDGPIAIETYGDALIFCDNRFPVRPHDAKFSLQHCVAVVAERGVPTLDDFTPESILALAQARSRVAVSEDESFTARFPDHYGARVTAGGRSVELIDTRGDPERPLARDGVIAKARELMAWGGVDNADEAVAACLEGDDPRAVIAVLESWL